MVSDIITRIENGESADDIIPYSCENLKLSDYYELLMIYIKYGTDEQRKKICKRKLKNYASGSDVNI